MIIGAWTSAIICVVVSLEVAANAEPAGQCRLVQLPSNIAMSRDLETDLKRMYLRSASFRAQCARIELATNLRVRMKLDMNIPNTCRAYTRFTRLGPNILADVRVPPRQQYAE